MFSVELRRVLSSSESKPCAGPDRPAPRQARKSRYWPVSTLSGLFRPVPDKRAFARYGFFWPVGAAVFASPLPTSPLPPPSGSWIWLFIPKMPFFDFSPGIVGGAAPVENLPVGLVGPALAVVASAMEPSTATARGAAISLVILGLELCRQCPALATTPLYTIGSRRRWPACDGRDKPGP
jgi:hypothetical protein